MTNSRASSLKLRHAVVRVVAALAPLAGCGSDDDSQLSGSGPSACTKETPGCLPAAECPQERPEEGDTCEGDLNCRYLDDACSRTVDVACSDGAWHSSKETSCNPPQPLQEDFVPAIESATAAWESSGPSDYTYVYANLCFCFSDHVRPVRVVVKSGVVTEALFPDGTAAPSKRHLTMRDQLERARAWATEKPHRFSFESDPELGYLLSADVDPVLLIADDEERIEVPCFAAGTEDSDCPLSEIEDPTAHLAP